MTGREKIRWIGAAAAVAALAVLGRLLPLREILHAFQAWIAGLGPAGYVLYVLAYVLVTVLMMPAVLMTLGAGFAFGLLPGFAVVAVGATLGAASSFLIARHLARERVARFAGGHPRYAAIDAAIGRRGWPIVFLLRLSPLVPFVFSNYFYGLTAIRFWPYVLASWIGMVPLQFLYVSLGVAAREASLSEGPAAAWKWTLLAAGALVTLAATAYAGKVVREALAETEGGGR
ncbi:MAG TPA: TVP38/TMEM64 family protein [Thermoanaerobaculia bacterium]|nr:TVP38/TMEM64 family protein [Thermoanaerobaculia bacterium]